MVNKKLCMQWWNKAIELIKIQDTMSKQDFVWLKKVFEMCALRDEIELLEAESKEANNATKG